MDSKPLATSTTAPDSATHCQHGSRRHSGRFGKGAFLVILALGAGMAGGFASRAFAGDGRDEMRAAHDPAKMEAHIDRMVRHLATKLDATADQQEKLAVIAKAAMRDLAPLHAKKREIRQRGIALLAAPQVDRAALEQVRAEQIALTDMLSKRLTQALADASEVLTPPQRQKLAEHLQKFGERFHRHGFGLHEHG